MKMGMCRVSMKYLPLIIVGSFVILISACTKDSGPIIIRQETDTISFNDSILPILVANCVIGCHPGYADLDLGAVNAYSDLVNVASANYAPYIRVHPSDPDNSVLYQKVAGNTLFGSIMPLYADPLTEEEVWLIYDWIAQGALDN